ncbi:MAG: polysaccharide deacetylase family protein [Cyclobacteriaceae bacterium]|nr:polysaccharide deacetylase family protein [Cyclobacteriaceae bacterium]
MNAIFRIFLLSALFLILSTGLFSQQVALTFDDAPRSDGALYTGLKRSEILIKKLKEYGIPQVAFFSNSINMDDVGTLRIKMYGQAGHIIGNHTHSHSRINDLGVEAYIQDIQKAHDVLQDLPGFHPWFRFPFLDEGKDESSRDQLRKALGEMGYLNGYVTIDNYDYYLEYMYQQAMKENKKINYDLLKDLYIEHIWESMQFYEEMGRKLLGRSPKHVLLLHENDLAALFLDDLISFIRGEGWEIISPVDAYKDPIAQQSPDVLMNNQGRIAALALEDGWKPQSLVQKSESEAYLKDYFARKKVFR